MAASPQNNVVMPVSVASEAELALIQAGGNAMAGVEVVVMAPPSGPPKPYMYLPADGSAPAPGTVVAAKGGGNFVASTTSASLPLIDLNVRYVDKGGSDVTGDGSRALPFATVQVAINAVAAAATVANPFLVRVSPGSGYGTFKLAANVYVTGSGDGAGNVNGAPLTGQTILNPDPTGCLGATFAGAVVKSTGLSNCALATAFLASFLAVGSTAASSVLLENVLTDSAVTIIGSGNLESATIKNLNVNAAANVTLTNMGGSLLVAVANDLGGQLVFSQSAAIQSSHNLVGCFAATLTATWTSAAIANSLGITSADSICPNGSPGANGITLTGAGVKFTADQDLTIAMPDAAAELGFGANATTTLVGVNGGRNLVEGTPTANRVLTIRNPGSSSKVTRITVRNLAAVGSGFNIDLTFPAGAQASGNPTYVPPGGQVDIAFDFVNTRWIVAPYTQAGVVAMAANSGVTAFIPADVTAASRIVATLKTWNGVNGTVAALPADRVVGTRAGGGGFKLSSVKQADGSLQTTDNGTYDWELVG